MYANSAVPESLNYPNDRIGANSDRVGLFQQPASVYTDVACDMGPACSAGQFFAEMLKIGGWQAADVASISQKVQRAPSSGPYANQVALAVNVCEAGGL